MASSVTCSAAVSDFPSRTCQDAEGIFSLFFANPGGFDKRCVQYDDKCNLMNAVRIEEILNKQGCMSCPSIPTAQSNLNKIGLISRPF